ncbi:hypothetical protein QYE76_047173 [Lolium multiflorum]|uniref:Uncharacterized protein n=1 Tax=Lolium multiflorum TaxID=4521 RepID=A0AAD8WZC4_LOLMU|nr:hypothetical protein QYE76_047173 [Lolium multiflorum]
MIPSRPDPKLPSVHVFMVGSQKQVRIGNRTLSRDESSAVQTLTYATAGNIPAVRKLMRQLMKSGKGVEETLAAINLPQFRGRGPLHMAAWAGRLEMCRFLVKDLHLNVNTPGDEGTMPLSYATYGCGSTSVVRFLLDHGAKPDKTNMQGFTPLHYAASTGTHTDPKSAKLWAANTRDTCEIAELLLSRGAYVDPICENGTPLHIAAHKGNVRMLELLLRHQADPNSVTQLFYTPLSMAIFSSSLNCAELLIKAGADVNAGRPVTPLIIAASYGFTDCIKCLLDAGADANIPDEFGRTAAKIAATKGFKDCVKILSPLTSPGGNDIPLLNSNDGCALKEQGDAEFEENDGFALKIQGDAAFEENSYADALALYTKAMQIEPDDSTLYAKRSLCWVHMSEQDKALDDAYTYRTMKMDLSNSCYEQTAALILVKEYARACRALVSALKLDLGSDDLD